MRARVCPFLQVYQYICGTPARVGAFGLESVRLSPFDGLGLNSSTAFDPQKRRRQLAARVVRIGAILSPSPPLLPRIRLSPFLLWARGSARARTHTHMTPTRMRRRILNTADPKCSTP